MATLPLLLARGHAIIVSLRLLQNAEAANDVVSNLDQRRRFSMNVFPSCCHGFPENSSTFLPRVWIFFSFIYNV